VKSADLSFCYREELGQYLALPLEALVSKKFTSSFDADINGFLLHFTCREAAMTPLSLLLPEQIINEVQSGWPVRFFHDRLLTGTYELLAAPQIPRIVKPERVDLVILQGNLQQLRRNLELFGRSSPVLDLVMQRQEQPFSLAGASELLVAGEADLSRYARFFGVGDGLTPSFDDFLAGMLFVDRLYGYRRFVVPEAFWELAATRTTRQAVQQYRFADNGHFSRQFEQVAADLTQRQVGSAELVRLLGWGHSSGTDILCGIWLYFSQRVKMIEKI